MKKNYLLGMFAATGMLLATSCSNDELEAAQSGNEAQVTFSLGLENGIGSRAISDGTKADKLVYAVYKLDANQAPVLQNVVGSNDNGQFVKDNFKSGDNVSVTLAKGQTYQVAFWAQDGDCSAYTTTDLQNVAVDYDNAANNAEVRDAFFKTVEFTVAGNKTIDVVLKRPFAQINVGVYESDWDAAVASGITIKDSKVVINNAATSINLLTGAVEGSTEVTYDLSAIPTETLEVETDDTKAGKEEYKWLSMSYILVADNSTTDEDNDGTLGDARTTLESLNYTFAPESGNNITFAEGLNSVPVQRNWRTNILGKILTGDIQFNITIDPVYDNDINYPNGSAQELELAAKMGGTVTLNEDVVLTEPLIVAADMVLNMNGKIITGALKVAKGISLTIENGKIQPIDSEYVNGITSNGNLTLNNVEVTSTRHAVRIESGSAVINGGIYKVEPKSNSTLHALHVGDDGTVANVIVKGGTFIGPKGTKADSGSAVNVKNGSTVTIEGGDFSGGKNKTLAASDNLTVTGGTFDQNPTTWIAAGYKAVANNGKYYVVAEETDAVAKNTTDLNEALANGDNVALVNDIAVAKADAGSNGYGATGISQLNGGVIDGNGNDISVNAWGTWDSAINTTGGTIKNLNVTGGMRGIFVNHNSTNNSKVILENVTIDGTVYTISCDQGTNQGLEAYNSTFNGWTSYAATIGAVKFDGCSFGEGQGYAFCRPYAATEFVNCDFAAGYEVDAVAAITFENCTIDGVALTAANLATLVPYNTANATLK